MQTPGLETPVRDDGLMTLMFNYGRYLLIQAQRIGGMPAAIEGIWCEEIQSPFNGDYHINAQQGTYWHAESCNLPEFHEPYLKLAQALTVNGSDVARKFYNSRGWTAHTITNPWLYALPGGEPHWGGTIVGGAWLCVHLWEHYLYGEDKDYLKEVFPTMKGGALFLLDRLVVDPETGKKVIFPGNTPENFYEDEDGNPLSVSLGTAYDMGITRYLFKAVADAYEVLEAAGMAGDLEADAGSEAGATAASEVEELKAAYDELAYYGINSKGKFMEWQREFTEHKPFHRHISPLWCVYPGCEVSREETPELAEAAMVLLNSRTFTGQMWAMTWRCAVLARLHDGDRIDWILNTLNYFGITANLLSHVYFAKQDETTPETDLQTPFDNKAIFEIDGNTGYSAVVVEMLMQSHRTEDGLRVIELLPSLPSAWKSGSIRGMRARGEIIVDLAWENGELKSAEVTGAAGKKCIVKYKGVKKVIELTGEKVSVVME